eukprot:2151318-Rhodomonas_salina.1
MPAQTGAACVHVVLARRREYDRIEVALKVVRLLGHSDSRALAVPSSCGPVQLREAARGWVMC